MFTARQAYALSNTRISNVRAVLEHMIQLCTDTIRRFAELHHHQCQFRIPLMLIGYGAYDIERIKRLLRRHLRRLEFRVKSSPTDPSALIISWKHIRRHTQTDPNYSSALSINPNNLNSNSNAPPRHVVQEGNALIVL